MRNVDHTWRLPVKVRRTPNTKSSVRSKPSETQEPHRPLINPSPINNINLIKKNLVHSTYHHVSKEEPLKKTLTLRHNSHPLSSNVKWCLKQCPPRPNLKLNWHNLTSRVVGDILPTHNYPMYNER